MERHFSRTGCPAITIKIPETCYVNGRLRCAEDRLKCFDRHNMRFIGCLHLVEVGMVSPWEVRDEKDLG